MQTRGKYTPSIPLFIIPPLPIICFPNPLPYAITNLTVSINTGIISIPHITSPLSPSIPRPSRGINPIPIPIQTRIIIGISLAPKQIPKHAPQVGNIGLGLKLETATIGQILGKLRGASLTQGGNRNGLLLLHNELILLSGGLGLESLPGQSPLEEVDEDISDTLEVITSRLLHSQVIVNRGITGSTRQRPPLPLGDMLEGTGVSISFAQSEIDAVDEIARAAASIGDEVGGFDIPVDQVAGVHQLHALQHLIGDHEDGLETEATAAFVELILERGAEQIHHHEVVGVLGAEVVDFGEAGGILELAVDFVFVAELGAACSVFFEFDGHLLPVGSHAQINITE